MLYLWLCENLEFSRIRSFEKIKIGSSSMIQISNDLIVTLILQKLFCFQVRTWHNGTTSSFPVSRICINVSRSKRGRYSFNKIVSKDKELSPFFFDNETKEGNARLFGVISREA